MNPKIGTFNGEGAITYPTETLAGAPYSRGQFDPAPAIMHGLPGGHFAVGDVFPPKGFDVEAALAALKKELTAPTKSAKLE